MTQRRACPRNPATGTDNALAASSGTLDAFVAVMSVIKGSIIFYDLLEVYQAEKRPGGETGVAEGAVAATGPGSVQLGSLVTYSSCCVGWGFISDVLEGDMRRATGTRLHRSLACTDLTLHCARARAPDLI